MKAFFIGDEVSAAGFRLAGMAVSVPAQGEEGKALEEALSQANLVVIGANVAQALPGDRLEEVLSLTDPLVLVVPDVKGRYLTEDLAAHLRAIMGIGG